MAPDGTKLMPHNHPADRIYTVMSGVFYIGLGDQFDGDKVKAFPPGSVIVLPGGASHFHWAKSGEYVTQITAIGPLGFEYLNPSDDPRMLTPIHTDASRRDLIKAFGAGAAMLATAGRTGSALAQTNASAAPAPTLRELPFHGQTPTPD